MRASGDPSRRLGEAVLVREYVEELKLTQRERQMNELRRLESKLVLLEKKMDEVDLSAQLELFRKFLMDDARMSKLKEMSEARSTELDLFRVLRVHDSELAHSNFLAWLLRPAETHGIQEYFLRKFLERTVVSARKRNIPTVTVEDLGAIDWSETEVHREWRYIDILILNRNSKFVCAIENKIFADEGIGQSGRSQLATYREVLKSVFPDFKRHLVFLSPSGMESADDTERKYWLPEDYVTIHQLVSECQADFRVRCSGEVLTILNQYETTLRRNIVPQTSEIGRLAAEIYLEHREAIELIYQNKPDYRAAIKQILKEAIAEQDDWLLCAESADYVRFRPRKWDSFEAQAEGTSWAPASSALLLFEFWCPTRPTGTEGPGLTLGQGPDETLRKQLIETAVQNPSVFNLRQSSVEGTYTYLHEFRRGLLAEEDLGRRWADGSAKRKLMESVRRFAKDEFPQINEAIIRSLESYQQDAVGTSRDPRQC